MNNITRSEQFKAIFPQEPAFRLKQLEQALFDPKVKGWEEVTVLSKMIRQQLASRVPFISLAENQVFSSKNDGTKKALLRLADDSLIETVLMENSRNQFTVCLSSQVGCAMGCRFCATGRMGLIRSLTSDEIADQYRFWQNFLVRSGINEKQITNIVIMGMGEPLANYDNIKVALSQLIGPAGIGPTHITVSTIGLFPILAKILLDKDWPNVRLAISLHAADLKTRKQIIPQTPDNYYANLLDWSREYLKIYGNRSHYLSFEYIMIAGLNDSLAAAEKLFKLVKKIGQVKVNLIPCNEVLDSGLKNSREEQIRKFAEYLMGKGVTVTVRLSRGQDIAAACGQLIAKEKTSRRAGR
jgi:23S rRNA (adenine2503-C2)-methyltransferase